VTLRYVSGEGIGLLGCQPNMAFRTAICAVTAINVTPEMRAPYPELANIDLREYVNRSRTALGVQFSYDN